MTVVNTTKKTGNIRVKSQQKILTAASTEFVLQGYKGTTVQSIADRAKLPKANILYYFKNKFPCYFLSFKQKYWKLLFSNYGN